jgi:hypothetical protein
MTDRAITRAPRLFTVEAANRTLPLVGAIVFDLVPLWREVTEMRNRIQHLTDSRDVEHGNPYSDELEEMRELVSKNSQTVEGYIEELRQLGVEFKGPHGHVGFPAMIDGRLVYLSWQLGEPEVSYWMDLDDDFDDRQSLLAESVAPGDASTSI